MRALKQEEGFTIVETVVAAAILTGVLIFLVSILLNGYNLVYRGKDYINANNLLIQAAEETKATAFPNVESEGPVQNYRNSGFVLIKTVTPVLNSNSKLKRVDIEIRQSTKVLTSASLILYEKGL